MSDVDRLFEEFRRAYDGGAMPYIGEYVRRAGQRAPELVDRIATYVDNGPLPLVTHAALGKPSNASARLTMRQLAVVQRSGVRARSQKALAPRGIVGGSISVHISRRPMSLRVP